MSRERQERGFIQDLHIHSRYSDGNATIPTIIAQCHKAGCKTIAITDHCSEAGEFMYNDYNARSRDLEEYLKEIRRLKRGAKVDHGIKLLAGLEISNHTPSFSSLFQECIIPLAKHLDILLIDGWYVDNPLGCAISAKRLLDDAGRDSLHVVIAHPNYETFTRKRLQRLIMADVAIELNEAKISKKDMVDLLRLVKLASEISLKPPVFTLGSDAHDVRDAGAVPIVQGFIEDHGLMPRLLRP